MKDPQYPNRVFIVDLFILKTYSGKTLADCFIGWREELDGKSFGRCVLGHTWEVAEGSLKGGV